MVIDDVNGEVVDSIRDGGARVIQDVGVGFSAVKFIQVGKQQFFGHL